MNSFDKSVYAQGNLRRGRVLVGIVLGGRHDGLRLTQLGPIGPSRTDEIWPDESPAER
jgi:hypothetical protein